MLSNGLCKLFSTSVPDEEMSVNATLVPMLPLSSSDSCGSNSWNYLTRSERSGVRISTHSPRSEFCDLQKVQSHPRASHGFFYAWIVLFLSSYRLQNWDLPGNEWTHWCFLLVGEPMIPFSLLVSSVRVPPPASVTTDEILSPRDGSSTISCLAATPGVGVEEDPSRSSNPSGNGKNRSNMVSSTSFFSLKVSFGWRKYNEWYSFLFVNCYHGNEVFGVGFDDFLTFW